MRGQIERSELCVEYSTSVDAEDLMINNTRERQTVECLIALLRDEK